MVMLGSTRRVMWWVCVSVGRGVDYLGFCRGLSVSQCDVLRRVQIFPALFRRRRSPVACRGLSVSECDVLRRVQLFPALLRGRRSPVALRLWGWLERESVKSRRWVAYHPRIVGSTTLRRRKFHTFKDLAHAACHIHAPLRRRKFHTFKGPCTRCRFHVHASEYGKQRVQRSLKVWNFLLGSVVDPTIQFCLKLR